MLEHFCAKTRVFKVFYLQVVNKWPRSYKERHLPINFSTLYIGGKSSAIVLDDCDLDTTTKTIMSSSFRASGQRSYSLCRVFASKKTIAEIESRLHQELKKLVIGYGAVKGVYFGPLISEHWKKRYLHFGQDITQNGHSAVLSAKESLDYKRYNEEEEATDVLQFRQDFLYDLPSIKSIGKTTEIS